MLCPDHLFLPNTLSVERNWHVCPPSIRHGNGFGVFVFTNSHIQSVVKSKLLDVDHFSTPHPAPTNPMASSTITVSPGINSKHPNKYLEWWWIF